MTTESVEIRPAYLEDYRMIADISHSMGYPSPPAEVKKRLARILHNPDHQIYVAEIHGSMIVGFIHIYLNLPIESDAFTEIGALVVLPQHRRLGIGKMLLDKAVGWSAEKKLRTIRCRNHAPDPDSFAFFNRMSFKQLNPQEVFVYLIPS